MSAKEPRDSAEASALGPPLLYDVQHRTEMTVNEEQRTTEMNPTKNARGRTTPMLKKDMNV